MLVSQLQDYLYARESRSPGG